MHILRYGGNQLLHSVLTLNFLAIHHTANNWMIGWNSMVWPSLVYIDSRYQIMIQWYLTPTGYILALYYYLGATFKRSDLASDEAASLSIAYFITVFYYYVTSTIGQKQKRERMEK